jgi:hypothetical protein
MAGSLLAINERFSDLTGDIVRSSSLKLRGAAQSTVSKDLAIYPGFSDLAEDGDSNIDA